MANFPLKFFFLFFSRKIFQAEDIFAQHLRAKIGEDYPRNHAKMRKYDTRCGKENVDGKIDLNCEIFNKT